MHGALTRVGRLGAWLSALGVAGLLCGCPPRVREIPVRRVELPRPRYREPERYPPEVNDPVLRSRLGLEGGTLLAFTTGDITYAHYSLFKGMFVDGIETVASDLYGVRGRETKKLLEEVDSRIRGVGQVLPVPGYLDQRRRLYAVTADGTLYVIAGMDVVGKITGIGKRPRQLLLDSDGQATYVFVTGGEGGAEAAYVISD